MNVYMARKKIHSAEKEFIGQYVGKYLREHAQNLPVAVDGGSTNFYVLQAIRDDILDKQPTVSQILTNHIEGVRFAYDIPEDSGTVWRSTGGIVRPSRQVFTGLAAAKVIEEFGMWLCVVGVNGFVPPRLETNTDREHDIKKEMIKQAREVVVFPIDSSKWGMPAGAPFHTLDEIVFMGKDVVLVTCYPILDRDEDYARYEERTEQFWQTLQTLANEWDYEFKASVAHVERTEEYEIPIPTPTRDILEESQAEYVKIHPSVPLPKRNIVEKLQAEYEKIDASKRNSINLVIEIELSEWKSELKDGRTLGFPRKRKDEMREIFTSTYNSATSKSIVNFILNELTENKVLSLPQLLAKSTFPPFAIREALKVLLAAQKIETWNEPKTGVEVYQRHYPRLRDKILSQISKRSSYQ